MSSSLSRARTIVGPGSLAGSSAAGACPVDLDDTLVIDPLAPR